MGARQIPATRQRGDRGPARASTKTIAPHTSDVPREHLTAVPPLSTLPVVRRVQIAALALALAAAPSLAEARRPTTAELAEDGLTDPRKRPTPPRHRLRLALLSDAMRTSAALGRDGKTTRFYYATLMIDLAYQVQVLKYMMIRPSFALGGNVANSRQAMPGAFQPGIAVGYQGSLLGIAAVYSVLVPFPRTIGANNGHGGPTQPAFIGLTPLEDGRKGTPSQIIQGEISFTTRVDRGALNFALRVGAMHYHLKHLNIDDKRASPMVTLTAGWFFDLGARRRRRAEREQGR